MLKQIKSSLILFMSLLVVTTVIYSKEGLSSAIYKCTGTLEDEDLEVFKKTIQNKDGFVTARYGADYGSNSTWVDLGFATVTGRIEAVKLFLDAGANVNRDGDSQYYSALPLYLALVNQCYEHLDIVELLLAHGADVNGEDVSDRMTPLFPAVGTSSIAKTKILLKAGANPNHQDDKKRTPLVYMLSFEQFMASDEVKLAITKLLIEHGADPNLRDNKGHTALYYVNKPETKKIFYYLKKRGAVLK